MTCWGHEWSLDLNTGLPVPSAPSHDATPFHETLGARPIFVGSHLLGPGHGGSLDEMTVDQSLGRQAVRLL